MVCNHTKREGERIIDAIFDPPPYLEFNQTELANMANVSRQSVGRHIDLLAGLKIIEPVQETPLNGPSLTRKLLSVKGLSVLMGL